jgi:uncharacterized protein (DUF1684 family)
VISIAPSLAALLLAGIPEAAEYRASIEAWRAEREAKLRADDGWLVLAGLYWLKPGENRFGSSPDNEIVLPASAPAHAGTFNHAAGKTTVTVAPGVRASVGGEEVVSRELRLGREPDVLVLGPLSMLVIRRGERYAIRARDKESENRKRFKGLEWYPVDPRYRVVARFVPYGAERRIPIANILGGVSQLRSPGSVVFELDGQQLRLEPVYETDDAKELFFIFKDKTAPRETYGAGRFVYSELPEDGRVVLDFNKAYSPPCAYTPYATCPLPPKQNELPVRIAAGERFSAH